MPALTPAEVKNVYSIYRQEALRINEHDCIGPRNGMPSLQDKARVAAREGRHQDAIDAYSLALCYSFAPRLLGQRSQVYLEANNFRLAYIDACEALRLNDILKGTCAGTKNLLTDAEHAATLCRKALSLEGLGFCEAARETLRLARMALADPSFIMQVEIAEETLIGKKDSPSVSESFLTDYDPLESDSLDFGREFFLGDVNRFVLNGWKRPSDPEKRLEFDFTLWKPITSFWGAVIHRFDELYEESPVDAAAMVDASTIGLCFTDEFWLDRAEKNNGNKEYVATQ